MRAGMLRSFAKSAFLPLLPSHTNGGEGGAARKGSGGGGGDSLAQVQLRVTGRLCSRAHRGLKSDALLNHLDMHICNNA